jgi:hypothetical protein
MTKLSARPFIQRFEVDRDGLFLPVQTNGICILWLKSHLGSHTDIQPVVITFMRLPGGDHCFPPREFFFPDLEGWKRLRKVKCTVESRKVEITDKMGFSWHSERCSVPIRNKSTTVHQPKNKHNSCNSFCFNRWCRPWRTNGKNFS